MNCFLCKKKSLFSVAQHDNSIVCEEKSWQPWQWIKSQQVMSLTGQAIYCHLVHQDSQVQKATYYPQSHPLVFHSSQKAFKVAELIASCWSALVIVCKGPKQNDVQQAHFDKRKQWNNKLQTLELDKRMAALHYHRYMAGKTLHGWCQWLSVSWSSAEVG